MVRSVRVKIAGLVQGVGFRPFIYRVAVSCRVKGWIRNTNEGVDIRAEGAVPDLDLFLERIARELPPAAFIEAMTITVDEPNDFDDFLISGSEDLSEAITAVSPDIAVCADCLSDMKTQPHRLRYPFTNCTNCGPRFSIIRQLPYDRSRTSMDRFVMCPQCMSEYGDILDRRFHAQPVACNRCGPRYSLLEGWVRHETDIDTVLPRLADLLMQGETVAIKGMGGYHLACDPFNDKAVERLREIKRRDGKPFAVMFRDMVAVEAYARVSKPEREALGSWQRPIVILEMKREGQDPAITGSCTAGLPTVGAFLPYMPLHYMLFDHWPLPALVMTSGNLSSDPVIISDAEATGKLSSQVRAILVNDREIVHRTDDSVVRVIDGKPSLIRRSRGYVPTPVRMDPGVDGILAMGAELSAVFCIGKDSYAIPGPYIGDLSHLGANECYDRTLQDFTELFRFTPSLVACDMHPAYHSTQKALEYNSLPITYVQHHHAHVVSCMAEHSLEGEVIGVAMDGTGWGTDGRVWGSEFMVAGRNDFRRMGHFGYLPLPGGDIAAEEPWRTATGYLYRAFGKDMTTLSLPPVCSKGPETTRMLIHMIDSGTRCPESSGAGRLFDAVAAITGLCLENSFPAEGPVRLESLVLKDCTERYPCRPAAVTDLRPVIRGVGSDMLKGVDVSLISTRFHNTVIYIIFESVLKIRDAKRMDRVILSGGVFQNRYLVESLLPAFRAVGLDVYVHEKVPANDGGISLGQLAVASERRKQGCV